MWGYKQNREQNYKKAEIKLHKTLLQSCELHAERWHKIRLQTVEIKLSENSN
jgi:hypothetical protein